MWIGFGWLRIVSVANRCERGSYRWLIVKIGRFLKDAKKCQEKENFLSAIQFNEREENISFDPLSGTTDKEELCIFVVVCFQELNCYKS
jgi:hypothetical protein